MFSAVPVLAGDNWNNGVAVAGFEAGPDTDTTAAFNSIGPGFFKTMGMPLVQGRDFSRADGKGAPKVAIVNEAFARKFNLGDRAVGSRMKESRGEGGPLDIEIVAVVQDARSGKAVTDATVEVLTPRDALVTTLGAADGEARSQMKEGPYRLRVTHPRFAPEVRQIQVIAGQTTEVRVRLAPRSGAKALR